MSEIRRGLLLSVVVFASLTGSAPAGMANDGVSGTYTVPFDPSQPIITVQPAPRTIKFDNGKGQYATIDFSGPTVTYSGNMKVDESARMFFDLMLKSIFKPCEKPAEQP
jgi:hypothetical protein